jgi:hypothetical protein
MTAGANPPTTTTSTTHKQRAVLISTILQQVLFKYRINAVEVLLEYALVHI